MSREIKSFLEDFYKGIAKRNMLNDFFINDIEKDRSGVYLIYSHDNQPLYIGQSVNLRNRMRTHMNKSEFKDEIGHFQILYMRDEMVDNKEERRRVESLLIDILNPKYNKRNREESHFEEMAVFNKVDYSEDDWWKRESKEYDLYDRND